MVANSRFGAASPAGTRWGLLVVINLARWNKLQLYVAQLDDVTCVQDRPFQLDAIHTDPVRAVAVHHLVAATLDGVDLGVNSTDGGVVDR